jgi:hypothetical protein
LWEQSELDGRVAEAIRLCHEYAMPHHTAVARIFEGYAISLRGDLRGGGAAIREGLADYVATGAVVSSAPVACLASSVMNENRRCSMRFHLLVPGAATVG